jgi:hypothetical protein
MFFYSEIFSFLYANRLIKIESIMVVKPKMSQVWVAFAMNNCEGVPDNELPRWVRDPHFAQNVRYSDMNGKVRRYSQISPNFQEFPADRKPDRKPDRKTIRKPASLWDI